MQKPPRQCLPPLRLCLRQGRATIRWGLCSLLSLHLRGLRMVMRWRLASHRDAAVPPALVDIRREQTPAELRTRMRVKKKSFGYWQNFVRVYVRMMPQHSDSPVPGELKHTNL